MGLGKKRSSGSSLFGSMWNLSPDAYDTAWMPSAILMVNMAALMGPKISSTLTDLRAGRGRARRVAGGEDSARRRSGVAAPAQARGAPGSCSRGRSER